MMRRIGFWVAVTAAALLLIGAATASCGGSGGDTAPALLGVSDFPALDAGVALDEELANLKALPAPENASAEVFAALKIELAHMLSELGAERFISAPPMTPGSQAQLNWNPDTSALYWGYCCSGDYNQDSLVGVNDITPLGQNYLVEVPADPDSLLAVVDGNGNGLIEVADITPIGQNFQVRVTAYNVYSSASLNDYPNDASNSNGAASLLGTVPFPEGPPPAGQRRMFSFTVTDPQPETYFWVRPTDGASEGTPSSYYLLSAPANTPPVASLTADPVFGDIPMLVEFDASASSDSDGEIVKFEWDWDGADNGWAWEDTGTTSIIEHTFAAIDTYPVTVRVTDDGGAMHQASVDIRATSPGNDPPAAVLTADITSGNVPLTVNFGALMSSDPDGEISNYEWDLDGDDNYGETGNEAAAAGSPLASYTYSSEGSFFAKVRVTDNEGADDVAVQQVTATRIHAGEWVFVTLDSVVISGNPGYYSVSLNLVNDKPAVAYAAGTVWADARLKYVSSPTGSGVGVSHWNDPIEIEFNYAETAFTAIAEVESRPAIVWFDWHEAGEETVRRLKFFRAGAGSGDSATDWNQQVIVADGLTDDGSSFRQADLEIVDGNPAIVYSEGGSVYYTRSSTPTGSSTADWQRITIDSGGCESRGRVDMAIVAGNPAITYSTLDHPSGGTNTYRRYIRSSTTTGANPSDWGAPIIVSGSDGLISFQSHSFAIVDGRPAVVFNVSNGISSYEIKYAISTTATGEAPSDWTTPVTTATTNTGSLTTNLAEVDGYPAFVMASWINNQHGLKYSAAEGDGSTHSDWELPVAIESDAWDCAMLTINGNPAIVYCTYNSPNGKLIYAYYDR